MIARLQANDTGPDLLDAPGGRYWHDLNDFIIKKLLGAKLISPEDLSLFKVTENVDEAVGEILGFFRNYHSMRYVHNHLVLRLRKAPTGAELDATFVEHHASQHPLERGAPTGEHREFVVGVFDTDSSPAWMSSRPMLYLPALPVRRPPAVMGMTRPALRPMARL